MTCKLFYAKKDQNGFPIPGTMMGYDEPVCNCDLVQIEATDTFTGVNGEGKTVLQSFHPKGLRYFVRIDCETGGVLGNSLFISLKHPGGNVAEFKKTYIAD